MSDYLTYRGTCREACEAAVAQDPTLTLMRGYYLCPFWGEQAHWWTVRPDGLIYDPTALQFPSKGMGEYVPFGGAVPCSECGEPVKEEDAIIDGNGHYAFCSYLCNGRFVGVL